MDLRAGNAFMLHAPDYGEFHYGCGYCGRTLSQVRDTVPLPCFLCNCAHYCSPGCMVISFKTTHRPQCRANIDAEIDISSMYFITKSGATWDLRKWALKWHDEVGDATIAALNLHNDPSTIDQAALVIHLSYIPKQIHRVKRFRLSHTTIQSLSSLSGASLDRALSRRATSTIINRNNGMIGCALCVMTCNVPGVGFVFYSTFVGPEPSAIAEPPPQDWQRRLWMKLNAVIPHTS